MLKHYIKFAFRNFRSNKIIFVGSLATLCLGALCISLLFSYVHNELTMDDFHKREKDIYMMTSQSSISSKLEPTSIKQFINFNYQDYPELESLVYLQKFRKNEIKLKYDENIFTPEGIITDSTFFNIFDFKLKIGNKDFVLKNPHEILLTETFSKKVFGNSNPIGKKITLLAFHEKTYTVNGIIENPPSNSSITFDFIVLNKEGDFNRIGVDFLLTNKKFNKKEFLKKITKITKNNKRHPNPNSIINIIPLKEVYYNQVLTSNQIGIISRHGDIKILYILMAIILVILIISALNFSNLQIISTNNSVKSNAINLVNGALKHHITYQKIIEVGIIILLSALIITGCYKIVLPYFNSFLKINLSPTFWKISLINGSILIILGLLSLIYPIIIALRIPLINSLKNQLIKDNQLTGKKSITILQYALTLILFISTVTVVKQLDLMLNKNLNFTKENIINTKLFYNLPFDEDLRISNIARKKQYGNYQYVKNKLASHSSIKNFSQGGNITKPSPTPWKRKDYENEYSSNNTLIVGSNYKNIHGLEFIEGRFFETKHDKTQRKAVIINEAAKKKWGIKNILETKLLNVYWNKIEGFEIIGVFKDFNNEHLSTKPKPLMMIYGEYPTDDFVIQFHENRVQEGLQFVESLFKKVNPRETFNYSFLSDEITALYQKEKRLSTIYIAFTIIALLISFIGLFTIALYDTQRRVKEIGIRKVNGATIKEILYMLNKDFVKWVLISFIIACPIAYYAMSKWLENFAYKTDLNWWVFALAGVFTLTIALLTVSWQSYRAATRNPVESLRDE